MKGTRLQFHVNSFYHINLSTSLFPTILGRQSTCAGTTPFRLAGNGVSSMDSGKIFHNESFSSSIRPINMGIITFLKITSF